MPLAIGWSSGAAWTWMSVCGVLGSIIYSLDIVMNFHTGFLVRWDLHTIVVQGEAAPGVKGRKFWGRAL